MIKDKDATKAFTLESAVDTISAVTRICSGYAVDVASTALSQMCACVHACVSACVCACRDISY